MASSLHNIQAQESLLLVSRGVVWKLASPENFVGRVCHEELAGGPLCIPESEAPSQHVSSLPCHVNRDRRLINLWCLRSEALVYVPSRFGNLHALRIISI